MLYFISEVVRTDTEMDEVARNLYNFRLDHDYTPLTFPPPRANSPQEEDELAKKLSMLDGPETKALLKPISISEPPSLIMTTPLRTKTTPRVKLIQSITLTPPLKNLRKVTAPSSVPVMSPATKSVAPTVIKNEEKIPEKLHEAEKEKLMISELEKKESVEALITPVAKNETPQITSTPKGRAKVIKTVPKKFRSERARSQKPKTRVVKEIVEDESDDEGEDETFQDEDFDFEMDDDERDSDFDYEEEVKVKQIPKRRGRRTKSETKIIPKTVRTRTKSKDKTEDNVQSESKKDTSSSEIKVETKLEKPEKIVDKLNDKSTEKSSELKPEPAKAEQKINEADNKPAEKKPPKKEKKVPKPILDDFALFSTPDIIRRVGGKEPTTPGTPLTPEPKPAKITQESRAKSTDTPHSPTKHISRHSLDGNKSDKEKDKDKEKEKDKEKDKEKHIGHHFDKSRERRTSSSSEKSKRISIDEKLKSKDNNSDKSTEHKRNEKQSSRISEMAENILNTDEMPSAEDIRSIILSEDTKSFTTSTLSMDPVLNSSDPSNINLDGTGLDLDPTLLDNLNNDEISEDILYQVAQSLVSNPELQNAIDKGINEGVLDPMAVDHNVTSGQTLSAHQASIFTNS